MAERASTGELYPVFWLTPMATVARTVPEQSQWPRTPFGSPTGRGLRSWATLCHLPRPISIQLKQRLWDSLARTSVKDTDSLRGLNRLCYNPGPSKKQKNKKLKIVFGIKIGISYVNFIFYKLFEVPSGK